jgi:hypothetical protein
MRLAGEVVLLFMGNIVKRRNPLFDIESAKVGRRLPMSASRKSCRKNRERKTRGQKPSESRHCDRTSLGRTTAERREGRNVCPGQQHMFTTAYWMYLYVEKLPVPADD